MSNALDQIQAALPARSGPTSQTTRVEQARAAAEVAAAIRVAQDNPRNTTAADVEMRRSCNMTGLANRAFYSVPNRGSGLSVHLARELARIWGNVQYGVHELSRDDEAGMSEIQAYAWDVQTNTRSVRTFQVPHARMKGRARQQLTDLGDIYSNNQNVGARAVRECIFSVLPPWFTEEAENLCRETKERGSGEPIETRIAEAVRVFGQGGITQAQLEARVGRPAAQWDAPTIADLEVLYASLRRGEITKDEAFPDGTRITAADIAPQSSQN